MEQSNCVCVRSIRRDCVFGVLIKGLFFVPVHEGILWCEGMTGRVLATWWSRKEVTRCRIEQSNCVCVRA
jgi:hypothetical protein